MIYLSRDICYKRWRADFVYERFNMRLPFLYIAAPNARAHYNISIDTTIIPEG
jgi:hypothetical protein